MFMLNYVAGKELARGTEVKAKVRETSRGQSIRGLIIHGKHFMLF